ncbi:SDR family NAD(P)-dependent oxidoreductase [Planctomicrobium piriforme]|uniref:3-oxoacyl-[acyl-carrier protein] reductase n=1 Tax=Planctomicrobium piriforme TaxID=1576369 RepID=A0A1I3HP49_9PLAN|nr:SDR family NAD(P)-dependent oxidoreductase [Planctomicrobium piriforme]SFI37548.1 3-oxoacyl-[acyl-carrier protein] reductase [Planctomicrobium piriforme]
MAASRSSPFADLTGKRAVITGGSSGIGRAIALELARGGCDVIVHYGRSETAAQSVADEITAIGRRSAARQLAFPAGNYDEFVDSVWQIWGGVDIWVNNAGADLLTGSQAKLPYAEKLALLWQVDVAGTLQLCKAVLPRMKAAHGGVIINIGWDQADRGMEGDSAELFSAAKNAIMGFTRSFALTAAPEVRVNCIAPGWIQTAWGEHASQDWQDRVVRETPLRRWGLPEDIARLTRFLVSDDASYLTGQVINANGGAVR